MHCDLNVKFKICCNSLALLCLLFIFYCRVALASRALGGSAAQVLGFPPRSPAPDMLWDLGQDTVPLWAPLATSKKAGAVRLSKAPTLKSGGPVSLLRASASQHTQDRQGACVCLGAGQTQSWGQRLTDVHLPVSQLLSECYPGRSEAGLRGHRKQFRALE